MPNSFSNLRSFTNFRILLESAPQTGSTTKRLEQYKLVANGVAECFSLYTYFISLVQKDFDPKNWDAFKKSIYSKTGYEEKWKHLGTLAEKLYEILVDFSKRKNQNLGHQLLRTNFVSENAKNIRSALQKYKQASDLIREDLGDGIDKPALKMIDDAISRIEPFKLTESLQFQSIMESEKRPAPAESAVLELADTMAAQIINLRLTLRDLASTLPQLQSSADQSESNILDPLAKKIEDYIKSDFRPKENLPVTKQVKQLYASKGWEIENQFQKYMVDAWNDLITMQAEIEQEAKKIEGYKGQAVEKYQVRNDAQEFIEAGNRIVKLIKDQVFKELRIDALKFKSGSVLPMGPVQGKAGSLKLGGGKSGQGSNPFDSDSDKSDIEQLQNFLIKKYQTN
jgi:hypothetical protein